MPDQNRSVGDAIKIAACVEAAVDVVALTSSGLDDEEVVRQIDEFSRKLYHRITRKPWRGGYHGWTPDD